MTDFLSLCKDRYAVRKFTDKMVSEEDIAISRKPFAWHRRQQTDSHGNLSLLFRKKQKRNSASVIIESGLRQHPCMSLP